MHGSCWYPNQSRSRLTPMLSLRSSKYPLPTQVRAAQKAVVMTLLTRVAFDEFVILVCDPLDAANQGEIGECSYQGGCGDEDERFREVLTSNQKSDSDRNNDSSQVADKVEDSCGKFDQGFRGHRRDKRPCNRSEAASEEGTSKKCCYIDGVVYIVCTNDRCGEQKSEDDGHFAGDCESNASTQHPV